LSFNLKNSDTLSTIPIQPHIISSFDNIKPFYVLLNNKSLYLKTNPYKARKTITQVYRTSSNWVSMDIFYIPRELNYPETFTDSSSTIPLECSHTPINNEQIIKRAMTVGSQFLAASQSARVGEGPEVYGSQDYSEDSSIYTQIIYNYQSF